MALALGSWLLTFLILVHLRGEEAETPLRLVVRPPEEEEEEVFERIGWSGAVAMMLAYQTALGLSYAGILSALVYFSPRWFSPNDYDLAFTVTAAFAAARAIVGPPDEGLTLNLIRGPWRIVAALFLAVPWWFFPGGSLLDSGVGVVLRKPLVSRAEEFWTLFAIVMLWHGAKLFFHRIRSAPSGRCTRR